MYKYKLLECDPSCYQCTNFSNTSCSNCVVNSSYPYYTTASRTC